MEGRVKNITLPFAIFSNINAKKTLQKLLTSKLGSDII